jgi:hypothetical protein
MLSSEFDFGILGDYEVVRSSLSLTDLRIEPVCYNRPSYDIWTELFLLANYTLRFSFDTYPECQDLDT